MENIIDGYEDTPMGSRTSPKSTVTDDIIEFDMLAKNKFIVTKELNSDVTHWQRIL